MTLIIEDGTGVQGANSYVGLVVAKASITPPRPADSVIEAAAIRAFNLLDRMSWPGKRLTYQAWPRVLPGESTTNKKGSQPPNWVKLAQLRIMQDIIEGATVPTNWHPRYDNTTGEQIMPPRFGWYSVATDNKRQSGTQESSIICV